MTPGTKFPISSLSDVQWCENWHNCRNADYHEHELSNFHDFPSENNYEETWVHHNVKLDLDAIFVLILSHSLDFGHELEAINYAWSVRAPGPGRAILSWERSAEPSPLNYSSNKPEKCWPALPLARPRPSLSGNWDRREIKQTAIFHPMAQDRGISVQALEVKPVATSLSLQIRCSFPQSVPCPRVSGGPDVNDCPRPLVWIFSS